MLECGPLRAAGMPPYSHLLSEPGKLATDPRSQELAQLRDIHLPEAIGWWPPAYGWCLLVVLLIVGLVIVGVFLRRCYLNGRVLRQALRLLADYRQEYEENSNSELSASRVSELLKRVALVRFPRAEVASLQGESWILFLNNTSRGLDFNSVRKELLEIPYQPPKECELHVLFDMARKWIRQRRAPCLN